MILVHTDKHWISQGKSNMQLIYPKEEGIWLFSQNAGKSIVYNLVIFYYVLNKAPYVSPRIVCSFVSDFSSLKL